MKRIVTGFDRDGHSVFKMDDRPQLATGRPAGIQTQLCWSTSPGLSIPVPDGDAANEMPLFPQAGGSSFVVAEFAPNLVGNMHVTDTVDYVVVLSGELWLVLDGGAEVRLTAGDCVVQNGVLHRWDNRSSSPAVFAATLIGVPRREAAGDRPTASSAAG